jgi:hypothetical protein
MWLGKDVISADVIVGACWLMISWGAVLSNIFELLYTIYERGISSNTKLTVGSAL